MKKILLGALLILSTCSARRTDQPASPIMVGGPETTTPLCCMENEGPQQEPPLTKEFTFKELTNGAHVTLKVGAKYLNRTMVDVTPKKGVYYFMRPVKEVLSLEPSSQTFEIQSNQIGVFFMPVGANKPGTRTMPGFGPFKIVPVDHKNPSLSQVYLQNALDPTTPQYVQIDAQGTDRRDATLENATIFCIKVE